MLHLQRMEHLLLLCWLGMEHKSLRTLQCPTFSLGPEAKITLSPYFLSFLLTTPLISASVWAAWISPMVHTHIYTIKALTTSGNRSDKGWKGAMEEDVTFKNWRKTQPTQSTAATSPWMETSPSRPWRRLFSIFLLFSLHSTGIGSGCWPLNQCKQLTQG